MPSARLRLTEADLEEAARLHKSRRRGHGYGLDVLMMVPLVWTVLLIEGSFSEILVLLAACVGALLGICIFILWRAWRWLTWRRGRDIVAMDLQEIVWSVSGISITVRTHTSFYPWSAFKQWSERDGLFLLYSSFRVFLIVPRRAFASLLETLMMENYLSNAGVRRVGPAEK